MAFTLPAVGDYAGYVRQGNAVLSNAKLAVQGDAAAISSLLSMGVALGQQSGSKLVSVLASTVAAGVSGFLVGGPVGAAIGIMAAVDSAASAIFSQDRPPPQALVAIQARVQAWNSAYALSDTSLHPQGWALYDYLSRKYPADGEGDPFATDIIPPIPGGHPSQSVCTPYLFPWAASDISGCDSTSGGFAGGPGSDPYTYLVSGDAMPGIPGESPQAIVAMAELNRPPSWSYGVDALGFQAGNFGYMLIAGKTALALATALGMLQVGAAPVSIANELMVQHSFYANMGYTERDDPVFSGLVDYYVSLAHEQQGTGPAGSGLLHLGPGGGFNRGIIRAAGPQPAQPIPALQRPVVKVAVAGAGLAALAVAASKGLLGSGAQRYATRAWRAVRGAVK